MKTNPSQPDRISANAAAVTANSSLQDNLRSLRLTYLFENAVPAAEQAARDGHGHLHYLQELIAGELSPCAMTKVCNAESTTPAFPSSKRWPDGIGTGQPSSTACKLNIFSN
jgi:hypothetical protein